MKLYISGKISGLERDVVVEKFAKAEQSLTAAGYQAVNPLKNGLPFEASWESHMAMDIIHLLGCDGIYLLPCWADSKGAILEKKIAEFTGKKLIYQKEITEGREAIVKAVSSVTGVDISKIREGRQTKLTLFAKSIMAKLLNEHGMPIKLIARELEKPAKNIRYSLRKYDDDVRFSAEFRYLDEKVREELFKEF
ncbi:DUF4406 domain-containing protein [Leadbetterella byssophila]|uniref:DUF4406 domain-containing protein n=1 Tax=Leadbetterella byssophila TaxID=316068 RepID=UPI0039A18F9F